MAVKESKNPSSLKIKLDLGMVDGKTKVRSKTFSRSEERRVGKEC